MRVSNVLHASQMAISAPLHNFVGLYLLN